MSSFFSIPISTVVQVAPATYVPPDDMQGLLEAVPQYVQLSMTDTWANVVINANGAGATLDGLWVWRLDQYKLPARLMTGYRNSWWQCYTGKSTEIRMFAGYVGYYFDASGRAIQDYGWEGWALADGRNGTINLHNFFVIPGYRNDGNSWVAKVFSKDVMYGIPSEAVQASAGVTPVSAGLIDLADVNAGEHAFQIQLNNLRFVGLWVNVTDFFKKTKSGSGENWTVVAPGTGNNFWIYPMDQWQIMWQLPISRLPPYVALGFVQFVGYL